jgi:gas vesicle protein
VADQINDSQSEGTSALAWFITGVVIGATVAVLYAPRSGQETRRMLSERTQKSREALQNGSQDLVDAGKDMFQRGRKLMEDASDLFERGRKLARG